MSPCLSVVVSTRAGASVANSAFTVAVPATPSAVRPAIFWNSVTAALVASPNVPVAEVAR